MAHPLFKESQHPRGPNGRFTRSFARLMSALDRGRASKAKGSFKPHGFKGPGDAHSYLSHLSGVKGGGIKEHIASGALGRATEALRAGKSDVPEAHVIAATMHPLPDGLDLYRSVPPGKFGKVDPKSLEGHLVSDAGYFPTTVAPVKSAPGSVRLHVQAPAGTHAAVDADSGQVVLDHGTQMAVDSVDVTPDGSTRINLVALPTEGQPAEGRPEGNPTPAGGGATGAPTPTPASAPSFDERVHAARTGDSARQATHHSLIEDGAPPLTAEQEFALTAYRGEDYTDINRRLRSGEQTPGNPDVDTYIRNIDAAMADSRLGVEVQAWRGMGNSRLIFGDRFDGDLSGMEWTEAAYVSTSTDRSISEDFAGNLPGAVMMRLVVPRGVGAIELSDGGYESEVMLQRGLRMRVVADRGFDEEGVRQLDVEVIPGD